MRHLASTSTVHIQVVTTAPSGVVTGPRGSRAFERGSWGFFFFIIILSDNDRGPRHLMPFETVDSKRIYCEDCLSQRGKLRPIVDGASRAVPRS